LFQSKGNFSTNITRYGIPYFDIFLLFFDQNTDFWCKIRIKDLWQKGNIWTLLVVVPWSVFSISKMEDEKSLPYQILGLWYFSQCTDSALVSVSVTPPAFVSFAAAFAVPQIQKCKCECECECEHAKYLLASPLRAEVKRNLFSSRCLLAFLFLFSTFGFWPSRIIC